MSHKYKPPHAQPIISSYFQVSPSPKKHLGKRNNDPIDLTSDGEPEVSIPPAKRLKTTGNAPSADPQAVEPGPSKADAWRYSPNQTKEGSCATEPRSPRAQKNHDKLKRILLQENNSLSRKRHETIEQHHSDEDHKSDSDDEELGNDSDPFEALSALASLSKAKGKGKRKATTTKTVEPSKTRKKPGVMGPSGRTYTDLELQILKLKEDNPGTILMIEVGYKFRFFGEDAKVAAKVLGVIAFMSRNLLTASISNSNTWFHIHLKNLLNAGYRVGVVRQTETAALKKAGANKNTLFKRQLANLYTAATYVEGLDSVDELKQNNAPPFMCLVEEKKGNSATSVSIGIITICPSTGDVIWDDFEDTGMRLELETRFAHTKPAEILIPKKEQLTPATNKIISHFSQPSATGASMRVETIGKLLVYSNAFDVVSEFYNEKAHHKAASENFKSGKLLAEITAFPQRVVIALAHAIQYLSEFHIADALLETKFFTKFATRAHMLLAANTLTNLEIYRNEDDGTERGSLIKLLDQTKTQFGARLLRHWVGRPLVDKQILQDRSDAVTEIIEITSDRLLSLSGLLKNLPDLAKGLCRIQYGQCTPPELAVLLPAFDKISKAYEDVQGPNSVGLKSHVLNDIIASLPMLKEPIKDILGAVNLKRLKEGPKKSIWTDWNKYPGISDADMSLQAIEIEIDDELKAIRKKLKLWSLQWKSIGADDYLVEVRKSAKLDIPHDWILHSRTKDYARYYTPSVRTKLDERAQRLETLQIETDNAFRSFLEEISDKYYSVLREAVNQLATADCLLSLAQVAVKHEYNKPEFMEGNGLDITEGLHPMMAASRDSPYIGNTVKMGEGSPINKIITGPNMGGKSSCVRMVALLAIMAQIGSYVPAKAMKLGLVDSILTRMGASDDIARGRSTFMMEMSETSEILHTATERSLVILDELGRGTATFDGMAIAAATLEYIAAKVQCKTLFITHYPLLATKLESKFPSKIQNLHMGYMAEQRLSGIREITFLYRLTLGLSKESFGIECGRLAKMPENILEVAAEKSAHMQADVEKRTLRARSTL
ncbi:hypothetical protein D9619_005575 [Psilocybe cf. subviscida]|uniref:MutS protein homolog 3 n=1 Tax=Psilocybe cf. subviscida TaxID=2480587 RepID=A0A8H5BWQ6_9AGAR|nr:hypothetical protein D9619_005575 [Psilocybe cf. subviscida]